MKIRDDHMYHGSVLNQIAEHHQFTAINALKVNGQTSNSAFKVNDDIVVYLKYATEPNKAWKEYPFTFNSTHLKELRTIERAGNNLHLALICVRAREICCFPYTRFEELIGKRREAAGRSEDQYTLLVTIKPREAFRVHINAPGKRKSYLDRPITVRRNACPNDLFR